MCDVFHIVPSRVATFMLISYLLFIPWWYWHSFLGDFITLNENIDKMGLNTVAQLTHIPPLKKKKKLLKIEIFRLWEIDILHWLSCCVFMDTTHTVCGDGCVCESEGLS